MISFEYEDAHPFDMHKPKFMHRIGRQRTIVGIGGMGGHIDGMEGWPTLDADDDGGVVEVGTGGCQLDKIPRLHLRNVGIDAVGAGARIAQEEVVKVLHTGPGRGAILQAAVVPAEDRGIVHDAAAGVQALAGEVGAVAAQLLKIIIGRISVVGPSVGVGDGCRAIIIEDFIRRGQGRPPPKNGFNPSICGKTVGITVKLKTLQILYFLHFYLKFDKNAAMGYTAVRRSAIYAEINYKKLPDYLYRNLYHGLRPL